jgi:hypothetical protein
LKQPHPFIDHGRYGTLGCRPARGYSRRYWTPFFPAIYGAVLEKLCNRFFEGLSITSKAAEVLLTCLTIAKSGCEGRFHLALAVSGLYHIDRSGCAIGRQSYIESASRARSSIFSGCWLLGADAILPPIWRLTVAIWLRPTVGKPAQGRWRRWTPHHRIKKGC